MSSQSFKAALLLATLAVPLGLAACADEGPWPLPTGYYYQNGKYHAPPGPQPVVKKIETEHLAGGSDTGALPPPISTTTTTTATTLSTSRVTAETVPTGDVATLVGRLFGDFGKPAEPVWIAPAIGSAPSPVLDAKLRSALTDQGIKVSDTAGGGPFGVRHAVTPGDGGLSQVTLTLASGGMKAAEASGPVTLDSDAGASMHASESHSMSSQTTSVSSMDAVPAGPAALPPATSAPTPLPPMHLND